MKQTAKNWVDELKKLKIEYKEQSEITNAPGNPYVVGLGAKIAGIESVLNDPFYSSAPELLKCLVDLVDDCGFAVDKNFCECGNFVETGDCMHTRAARAISKAVG